MHELNSLEVVGEGSVKQRRTGLRWGAYSLLANYWLKGPRSEL